MTKGDEKSEDTPVSHMVKQEDAAILREALAWVIKKSHPTVARHCDQSLKRYAMNLSAYCKCPQKSYVVAEDKNACLDCGKRHEAILKPI